MTDTTPQSAGETPRRTEAEMRQGCTCACCDHNEMTDCACECHASGPCSWLEVPDEHPSIEDLA